MFPPHHKIPNTEHTLVRPRLLKILASNSHRYVCLFGAPGVGKSTLSAQFVQQFTGGSFWIDVASGEDATANVLGQLANLLSDVGVSVDCGLDAISAFTIKQVVSELYSSLVRYSGEKEFCLVLDDAHHLIVSPLGYALLNELIAQSPSGGRLIITSRDPLAGPIAKHIAARRLQCLDTQSLLFDSEELSALFDLLHIPSGETANQIIHQTQGWVAGVVLFAQHLDDVGPSFEPLSRYGEEILYDYLLHEVFEPLSVREKFLLLRLAALPLFTLDMLVPFVSLEKTQLKEALDKIRLSTGCLYAAKTGPSGSDGAWYQMNPLFKRFLFRHTQETLSKTEQNRVLYQAGVALELAGANRWAADNYRRSASWQQLIGLCLREGDKLLEDGEHHLLLEWIEAIPDVLRDELPWLLVLYGRALGVTSLTVASEEWQKAAAQFEQVGDVAGLYMTWAGIALDFAMGKENLAEVDLHLEKLSALRERYPEYPNEAVHLIVILGVMWCLNWRCPDNFSYGSLSEECEALLSEVEDSTARVRLVAMLVWHSYNYGFVPLTRGVDVLLEQAPPLDTVEPQTALFFLLIKAMYFALRGDVTRASAVFEEAELLHQIEELPASTNLLAGRMTAFLLNEQPELVGDEALQIREHPEAKVIEKLNARIGEAWLNVQRENYSTAQPMLNNALKRVQALSYSFAESTCHFLLVVVNFQLGDVKAAERSMQALKSMSLASLSRIVKYKALLAETWLAIKNEKEDLKSLLIETITLAKSNDILNFHGVVNALLSDVYSHALDAEVESDFVCQCIVRQNVLPSDLGRTLVNWPWSVRIRALGDFNVVVNGETLDLAKQSGRPVQMLKLLVTRGREPILMTELVELLWPELDGEKGLNNYKVTLSRLRKLVGRDAVIQQDNRISLSRQHCWVDAWVVQGEVKRLLYRHSWISAKSSQLQRLVDLYRGPFLKNESDFWVLRYRETLHKDYLTLIKRLSNHHLLTGCIDDAVELARRGLSIDDAYEPLYVVLMHCFSSLKQKSSIVNVYEQYKQILQARFNLHPSPHVEGIYQKALQNA